MSAFQCPKCNKRFSIKPDLIGKKLRCPCGSIFTVKSKSPANSLAAPPQPKLEEEFAPLPTSTTDFAVNSLPSLSQSPLETSLPATPQTTPNFLQPHNTAFPLQVARRPSPSSMAGSISTLVIAILTTPFFMYFAFAHSFALSSPPPGYHEAQTSHMLIKFAAISLCVFLGVLVVLMIISAVMSIIELTKNVRYTWHTNLSAIFACLVLGITLPLAVKQLFLYFAIAGSNRDTSFFNEPRPSHVILFSLLFILFQGFLALVVMVNGIMRFWKR